MIASFSNLQQSKFTSYRYAWQYLKKTIFYIFQAVIEKSVILIKYYHGTEEN
jgi:hypothetical protein